MSRYAKDSFVTGVLGRVQLRSGVLSLVNAGHVLPILMRGGAISQVDLPVDRPFGFNADRTYRRSDVQLQPGDRLVIVTDGMLERRAEALELTGLLERTLTMHAREATRHLADAVLQVAGPQLTDDATILLLDWHGQQLRKRNSRAGADLSGDDAERNHQRA